MKSIQKVIFKSFNTQPTFVMKHVDHIATIIVVFTYFMYIHCTLSDLYVCCKISIKVIAENYFSSNNFHLQFTLDF